MPRHTRHGQHRDEGSLTSRASLHAKRSRLVAVMLEIKKLDESEYRRLLAIMKASARRSRRDRVRRASGVN